jgi:uncharacterized protein
MDLSTLEMICRRMADHVATHGLRSIDVVFHGGEPLLAGADVLDAAARLLRTSLGPDCAVRLSVQTNGVLLSDAVLGVLHRHAIRVGVSLDGPPTVNDGRRVFADGRGTHAAVAETLHALRTPPHSELFSGLLCTIDVRSDPVSVYESLLEFRPPAMDFLLPHGNWTDPPPLREPGAPEIPYGRWLAAVFDRWYGAPAQETGIRFFEQILNGLLGGASTSELIGLSPAAMVVLDTAGRIEQVDSLRSVGDGAAATGLDVRSHSFDDALAHPGVVARQIGADALSETCRRCAVHRTCGAGFYPHRFDAGTGYRNPSVYCPDLKFLISHIEERLRSDLGVAAREYV